VPMSPVLSHRRATIVSRVASGRRQYSSITSGLRTWISPSTPSGTGRPSESRISTWVVAIGRPTVSGCSSRSAGPAVVASDGELQKGAFPAMIENGRPEEPDRPVRRGEERGVRRLFEDAAGMQHGHPVADLGDDAEIMSDEEDGGARLALQLADEAEDLALDGDVERGRRLVGDDEARAAGEGHGDEHPLAHAAGTARRDIGRGRGAPP